MPKLRVIIKPPPEPQGEPEQQVEALRDYLLQMSEELAYVLTHLEADNINDSTFERIQGMIPRPYTGLPVMDGEASPGQSAQWARGDHRHKSDTSKADKTTTVNGHALSVNVTVTKGDVGLGNVANERQYSAQNPPPIPTPGEVGAIPTTEKGSAGGVAELDATGMVPSAQLPSYVDDVLEYPSLSAFPVTGESGKIYVALDTSRTYRWSGSAYVEISESLALGETSSTAYRGDRGKAAYEHSQTTSGNPHNVTAAEVGARPDTWTPSASDVGAQPTITASGILKGDGLGGISEATAGTDYQAPLTAGVDYQTPLVAGTDYQTPLVAGTDYATPAQIPTVPDPSDAAPQDLGTAAAGSSGDYSRADHVHNLPDADDIGYDNTQSGLMATDVQAAIDELAQGGGGGGTAASAVSYDNTGSGLAAFNVQDAIDEVYGEIPSQPSDIGAQEEIAAAGILKGDGQGGVSAATAGTDYQAPLTAGTDYATPTQLDGKANQTQLAYVETGATANRAYVAGEFFCRAGLSYRAKTDIPIGSSFTPGTNCEESNGLNSLPSTVARNISANSSATLSLYPGHCYFLIVGNANRNSDQSAVYVLTGNASPIALKSSAGVSLSSVSTNAVTVVSLYNTTATLVDLKFFSI